MSLPEGAALGHNFSSPVRRSQQKMEKATAPPPPVRYAGISHTSPALTEPGSSVLPTRRRDGVLRRDIGDAERCERVFRKRPQGARSEARAGPLRRRGGNIRSTVSRTHRAMESTAPLTKTKKVKHKSPDSEESGLHLCAILGSNQHIRLVFRAREENKTCRYAEAKAEGSLVRPSQ